MVLRFQLLQQCGYSSLGACFFPGKLPPAKAQRKKSVNSKENLQRCLNLSVKKEHESSSLFSHFFWEIRSIGYFPISCWDNNRIDKGQKYFWPRNKAYKAQLCPWTHTLSSIVCHSDLTAMTELSGWGSSKLFNLRWMLAKLLCLWYLPILMTPSWVDYSQKIMNHHGSLYSLQIHF